LIDVDLKVSWRTKNENLLRSPFVDLGSGFWSCVGPKRH